MKNIEVIIAAILSIVVVIALILLDLGIGVWLWNLLMPALFGLPTISFWKFLGLFILARILIPHSSGTKIRERREEN